CFTCTRDRIVLLGKTGAGKSSLANTLFGEDLFTTNNSPNSETKYCQAETRLVNDRSITLIDTPGLFDVERSEEEMKPEIVRCITECAPGPHVFFIVLKVEKFTEHEKAVVTKICDYFSEDALKYAVIVFTHGEQLSERMTIKEFVQQNKNLSDLVEKCGGRCHVFDNKYWKNKQQDDYRSNQFQVEELLNTINMMVMENNGGYYTNEMLQVAEKEISKEEEHLKLSSVNMSSEEIRLKAKNTVSQRFLNQLAGTATGVLLGAFFGVAAMLKLALTAVRSPAELIKLVKNTPPVGKLAIGAAAGGEIVGVCLGVGAGALAVTGGVMGGIIGHDAAEGAETMKEAVEKAAKAVIDKGKATLELQ
uniref:AIG1-type G domain-containing protein n=1 Tax=Anabas testudineus TaxID=64144 RepID=A0A3Q1I8E1_ANATE